MNSKSPTALLLFLLVIAIGAIVLGPGAVVMVAIDGDHAGIGCMGMLVIGWVAAAIFGRLYRH